MTSRTELEPRGQAVELNTGMVCAGNRNGWTSTAERLPVVYRAGAMDANDLPSRIGDRLFYRDGRVVDVGVIRSEWAERDDQLREEYLSGFDGPMDGK